ncbi:DNA-binding response regulator [Paenibacillus ferrarius]|uniref:DNA-binding response regulator n=1 Tax=Paenibacillus ferrarius TaxID=1469647 RepID=A0A1V4HLC1_9BACL|nr:response regulator [Paenibacillus ferrarius]OPH58184.1 DNA-binding response regulator [Paenibacillus ferrarius]
MMQMLIVDDEILFVEGLKSDLRWEMFGVSTVHTAYNIRQAKEIFETHPIDMMLCDIEMPQGSGLELLIWVREHYPKTESIFLTCHADFKFAQQAIQLGCFDYLLKPVALVQLEEVIVKAGAKINKESELQQYSRYGQFWVQHQPILIERFWLDILHETIPSNLEAIRASAEDRNIPFSEEMRFLPILISIQRYHKELSLRDEKILEYAIQNSAEEMIVEQKEKGQVLLLGSQNLLAIVSWDQEAEPEMERLKQKCEAFISSCRQFFYCDISCYIGNKAYVHELPSMVHELSHREKSNVAYNNTVFMLSEKKQSSKHVSMPDLPVWSVMLKEGSMTKVLSEAERYLESMMQTGELDARVLHQFHHDFLQMLYHVIMLKGIQARELLSDAVSIELAPRATRSVTDTMAWIKHIMERSLQYVNTVEQTQSVAERVKSHIALHLNEQELSREEIANYVYLNPDYLDRIFKKETGISVTEYLVQERMGMAKELLSKSGMSISSIAAHVGYSNLAHFSKRFKSVTGMNPNDYRQQHGRNGTNGKSKTE